MNTRRHRMLTRLRSLAERGGVTMCVLVCAASWACGSGSSGGDSDPSGSSGPARGERPGPAADQAPPLEPLPMGKPDLAGYAYSLGPGREAFQRALAADERGDWAQVVAEGPAALAADPGHLEAHWHVALALARQQQFDQVAAHLSAAVAGDYMRWGQESLSDDALRGFHDTAEGRRFRALVERYVERFRRGVVEGVLVVGRRGKPWYPRNIAGGGNRVINHRGEIYAYELDTRRFLRVSRTNAALVGLVRAPGGTALAFASYRRVWLPPAADAGAEPYIRELQIGTIDLNEVAMSPREVILEDVAELWLGYESSPAAATKSAHRRGAPAGTGDRPEGEPVLVARVRSPGKPVQRFVLDTAHGHARPVESSAPPGDVLHVAYDATRRLRVPIDGVMADWDDLGAAGSFRLERTRKTVTLAGGELAHGHSMSWSPAHSRLAFATLPEDPCAASAAPVTLYVVEAATGKQRALASGPEPLAPMWVDEQRLAYMDSAGAASAVRVMDVATGEQVARIETEGGVGTDRLVGRAAPPWRCSGDEDVPSLVRPAARGR